MHFFFIIKLPALQEFNASGDVSILYQNKFLNEANFQQIHPYE